MTSLFRIGSACALAVAVAFTVPATANVLDPAWQSAVFATNRDAPGDTSPKSHTGLAWAPDGSDRLFVIEQGGRVRVLQGALSTGTGTWSTFATMSPVFFEAEGGLLGLAFDPDFANNHYVYFFVTVSASEQQIIRYDASGPMGTGRTIIRDGLPTRGSVHNGGGIGFGGDGKLYWAVGDNGGAFGLDNDLASLASKVGRANRDGTLPDDNPFDDGAGPNDDYIYARGMRNGFAMQTQPSTGDVWLGVAGFQFEQIFVLSRGAHGGWNNYENDQPPRTATENYVLPVIAYPTNDVLDRVITQATRQANVATFTTRVVHKFRVGTTVDIDGVADASFNGVAQVVAATPTPTTFTVAQPRPDATSSGGHAVTLEQGGCVTGGAFYDATLAPASYRGDFFYGDCNSGRIMRARVDPTTQAIAGISWFASDIPYQVDVAAGPDGALYYIGAATNDVHRAAYTATTQGLVVADRHLRIDERGAAITTVSLAITPSAPVTVGVARSAGDADVTVAAGASLTFTPANWRQPQAVRIAAAADADTADDAATITVTAAGLAAVDIAVAVRDEDIGGDEVIFANGFE